MTDREDRQRDLEARGGASRAVYPRRSDAARETVRARKVERLARRLWEADPGRRWPEQFTWDAMPEKGKQRYRWLAEVAIRETSR